jgi:hypothetical protein
LNTAAMQLNPKHAPDHAYLVHSDPESIHPATQGVRAGQKPITRDIEFQVLELKRQGLSFRQIGRRLNIAYGTACAIANGTYRFGRNYGISQKPPESLSELHKLSFGSQ